MYTSSMFDTSTLRKRFYLDIVALIVVSNIRGDYIQQIKTDNRVYTLLLTVKSTEFDKVL